MFEYLDAIAYLPNSQLLCETYIAHEIKLGLDSAIQYQESAAAAAHRFMCTRYSYRGHISEFWILRRRILGVEFIWTIHIGS